MSDTTTSTGTPDAGTTAPAEGTAAAATATTTTAAAAAAAADDGKTGTSSDDGGGKDGAATDAAPKPPASYTLTVPDGGRVSAEDLAALEAFAREQGWTNDQAQQALDGHAEAIEAQSTRFLEATTADPIYGGEHLAETQRRAEAALERLRPKGTPRGDGLRKLLQASGYGNHIEVISLLADIGAAMAEDGHVQGAQHTKANKSIAEILYPGQ